MLYKNGVLKFQVLPILISVFGFPSTGLNAQETIYDPEQTVARNWNEVLLFAIRHDFARPTVHARNLYHSSALMYDIWSVYDDHASPVFLGDTTTLQGCSLTQQQKQQLIADTQDINQSRETAIAFAWIEY